MNFFFPLLECPPDVPSMLCMSDIVIRDAIAAVMSSHLSPGRGFKPDACAPDVPSMLCMDDIVFRDAIARRFHTYARRRTEVRS